MKEEWLYNIKTKHTSNFNIPLKFHENWSFGSCYLITIIINEINWNIKY